MREIMIKVFGGTQVVKTDVSDSGLIGNTPDVEPFELFLELRVKSQWDWNPHGFHLVFDSGFAYYVCLTSKEDNLTTHFSKLLKKEDLTEEFEKAISEFFNARNKNLQL